VTTIPLDAPDLLNTALVRVTGGQPLTGRAHIQGSKNIALHLYAAALAADTGTMLDNCPAILDTGVCAAILRHAGCDVTVSGNTFSVAPGEPPDPAIHPVLGRRVRTTVVLAAALLARTGQVCFPQPGGDAFCPRLIDRHLAAMQAARAEVTPGNGTYRASYPRSQARAFTTDVNTPYGPSLGATVTAMILAARADGTSLITHPSIEPEVTQTAAFLRQGGAGIGWDKDGLHVTGTSHLTGTRFTVAGDRIEAATMLTAMAATGGRIRLEGISYDALPGGLRDVLTAAGVTLTPFGQDSLTAAAGALDAVEAATGPHPGLPTDTAPQLAAMLTQARGTSVIRERVYPRRDTHVQALREFGADISADGPAVRVTGPARLRAADAGASDIRAVTALLIAALAADGTSTIHGMYHLRRGYSHLLDSLTALGAHITTIPGELT
jgi:UDP-N-acetylglucosamine 1-carboxyvinyltransferase